MRRFTAAGGVLIALLALLVYPLRYELLLRNFEAGDHMIPWHSVRMPNRKTDTNNNGAFSTDHIGANYAWPEADYQLVLAGHSASEPAIVAELVAATDRFAAQ